MSGQGITKRVLAQTMKKFLSQRPLSKISVADLVEECGLNRNSFYYHFKDKYDLVNWIFYTEFAAEISDEVMVDSWQFVEQILHFFYNDREFYTNALSETGQNTFTEYFSELTKSTMLVQMQDVFEEDEYKEFYATFFVDAFIAAVSRWLREGAKLPPEKMATLMRTALTGAAVRVLEEEAAAETESARG